MSRGTLMLTAGRKGRREPELGTWVHFRLTRSSVALWPCLPCPPAEPDLTWNPGKQADISPRVRCLVRTQKAREERQACRRPVSRGCCCCRYLAPAASETRLTPALCFHAPSLTCLYSTSTIFYGRCLVRSADSGFRSRPCHSEAEVGKVGQ